MQNTKRQPIGLVSNTTTFDQLKQQYCFRIKYYFSCRLDSEMEVEQLPKETFRSASVKINHSGIHEVEEFLLTVAAGLLRDRWCACSERIKDVAWADLNSDDLHDQAASLYMKLRALQGNSAATAEISAAIHYWIGNDTHRQAAYDRVRRVWNLPDAQHFEWASGTARSARSNASCLWPDWNAAGSQPGRRNRVPAVNSPATLGWPDVVLLVFVFLLLLPMIYFVAVPEAIATGATTAQEVKSIAPGASPPQQPNQTTLQSAVPAKRGGPPAGSKPANLMAAIFSGATEWPYCWSPMT